MSNEPENQNTDAADSPYVEEKPTFWARLTKPRKAALITGAAIAAGTSIFAVNLALAEVQPNQPPQFGKGGHHQLPGFAPNAIAPTGMPEPGQLPPNTDAGSANLPPIHGVPPMAIHPEDGDDATIEPGDDSTEFGEKPHPPRDHGDLDHRDHHGDDQNESNEGDD